jgi:hypothetical protein
MGGTDPGGAVMNKTNVAVNIDVRIVPFGCASIELKNAGQEIERSEREFPAYSQLRTTTPDLIEIAFNADDYTVPKTTNGCP